MIRARDSDGSDVDSFRIPGAMTPTERSETTDEGFFRQEALQHPTGARVSGDLLRVPPPWTRWTLAFLVAVFVAAGAYVTLGSVTVYTRGLAMTRRIGSGSASVTVYFPERDR